jgi:hypothetical protein
MITMAALEGYRSEPSHLLLGRRALMDLSFPYETGPLVTNRMSELRKASE